MQERIQDWEFKFQFTHPGRGATKAGIYPTLVDTRFNSRTPGGVRLSLTPRNVTELAFQFTHPGRGATRERKLISGGEVVSIHAPREGCDANRQDQTTKPKSFNSRTPGGVRLPKARSMMQPSGFNSRTPGGVRPPSAGHAEDKRNVSIHAPREGCDPP